MYYDDGSEYTGEWHMALRHGEGTWTRTDGIVYRGQWEYDQPHKKGEIVIKSDYKYTGMSYDMSHDYVKINIIIFTCSINSL